MSKQTVNTYDNGSVETHPTYGPVAVQREVSLEAEYAGRYPRRGVDLVLGTAYEETTEWRQYPPFAARDSVDSDESDGNSHVTTANGSASIEVVLRLGGVSSGSPARQTGPSRSTQAEATTTTHSDTGVSRKAGS